MGCSSTRDVPARPQRAYGGGRVKMTQFRSAAAKPPLSKRRLRAALRNGHQPLESADLLTPIDVRAVERVAHHLDGLGFGVRRQSRRFQSGAYAPHSEMAISLLKARTFSLRSMCAPLTRPHHLDGLGFGVRRQSRRFQSGAYAPHSEMAISLLQARTFSLRSMCATLSA